MNSSQKCNWLNGGGGKKDKPKPKPASKKAMPKPKAAKPKPANPKAAKPKAASKKAMPKPKAAKPKAAKPKPASKKAMPKPKAAKPKAANPKAANPKAASKKAMPKPKAAKPKLKNSKKALVAQKLEPQSAQPAQPAALKPNPAIKKAMPQRAALKPNPPALPQPASFRISSPLTLLSPLPPVRRLEQVLEKVEKVKSVEKVEKVEKVETLMTNKYYESPEFQMKNMRDLGYYSILEKGCFYKGFSVKIKHQNQDIVNELDTLHNNGLNMIWSHRFVDDKKKLAIIMLSYAIWLINQITDDPECVFMVLQSVAHIHIKKEPQQVVLQDADGLFDVEDSVALWQDIVDRHGVFIVAKIKLLCEAQELQVQHTIHRALADPTHAEIQFPSTILFDTKDIEGMGSDKGFVFFTRNKVLPENLSSNKFWIVFLKKLYVVVALEKMITASASLPQDMRALLIYKFLKKVVPIQINIKTNKIQTSFFYQLVNQTIKHTTEPEWLLSYSLENKITTLVASFEQELLRLLQRKQHVRISHLVTKRASASGKSMDMLYLCGDETCMPMRQSDQLLKFLSSNKYTNATFAKTVMETMQILNPQACFLRKIIIKINGKLKTFKITLRRQGRRITEEQDLDVATYKQLIQQCQGRKLLSVPIGLHYDTIVKEKEENMYHANMLIIDTEKKECEHFEPHGRQFGGDVSKEQNQDIEQFVKDLCGQLFPGYKYIPRTDATDFQGQLNLRFEKSEHGGTCLMWSLWYAYLRLSHPEFAREVILEKSRLLLGQNDFKELEKFIIKFISQLNGLAGVYMVNNSFFNAAGRFYY